jgi:membrane protein implicated in regulation of membrane protease activity
MARSEAHLSTHRMKSKMSLEHEKGRATLRALVCLMLFEVISAVPYGVALVIDPSGGLVGMPVAMLKGSPFHDFRIPGLILFVVLGLGALIVAIGLLRLPMWNWAVRLNPYKHRHWVWAATVLYGLALIIWIAVEVTMIGLDSWLQPFHFCIGLAVLLLSLAPATRKQLNAQAQSNGTNLEQLGPVDGIRSAIDDDRRR